MRTTLLLALFLASCAAPDGYKVRRAPRRQYVKQKQVEILAP